MGEYDDLIAAVKDARPPAKGTAGADDYSDLIAAVKSETPAAPQRSFLGEAGHRAAEAGRSFVENVKNIPSTSGSRVWQNLKALGHPFAEAGREVADEAAHPLRTIQGSPLARWTGLSTPEAEAHHDAVNRELVRGMQSNVPLAGLAHERLTGFPETSAEDEAMAPHAAGAGQVTGMAALGLAPKVAPIAGRVVGGAANAAQDALAAATEASLARSAARFASSPAPVRTAIAEFAQDIAKHSMRHGSLAWAGHAVGGPTGALIGTGLSLAKPAWRAAVTAADEGLARVARGFSETKMLPAMEPAAAPVADAADAAAAENAAHLDRIKNPAGSIEMDPIEQTVSRAVDPKIAVLEDGLKDATPAQAKVIQAAIEGIKKRAEQIAGRPVAPPEKLAPSLEERVAATRGAPLRLVQPEEAPGVPAAPDPVQAPSVADPGLVERAVAAGKQRAPDGPAPMKPLWEPSKADERFAKRVKLPLEEYRAMMAKRTGFVGPSVEAPVTAPVEAAAPEVAPLTEAPPIWSPSAADHEFAKRIGLSTDAYRKLMIKRMAMLAEDARGGATRRLAAPGTGPHTQAMNVTVSDWNDLIAKAGKIENDAQRASFIKEHAPSTGEVVSDKEAIGIAKAARQKATGIAPVSKSALAQAKFEADLAALDAEVARAENEYRAANRALDVPRGTKLPDGTEMISPSAYREYQDLIDETDMLDLSKER